MSIEGRPGSQLSHAQPMGYQEAMSTAELRRKIKRAVDRLPPKRLASLADYVRFLDANPFPTFTA